MTRFLKYILPAFLISLFLFSCSSSNDLPDEDPDEPVPAGSMERTVIIYMAAENDLDSECAKDYEEILTGAKNLTKYQNLILYVDRKSTSEKPFIAKVTSSGVKKVREYETDSYACNPEVMKEVMQWIVKNYPAKTYGLVMWGHSDGTGWYMHLPDESYAKTNSYTQLSTSSDSVATSRAFVYDTNEDVKKNPKWMNVTTFAEVLATLPHFEYIFFDVCSMMTAEVAYEIRKSCDYIIGSPAEIPVSGAPYTYVVADLFLPTETLCKTIVDDYISRTKFSAGGGVPLSVVKTSNMDVLATATQKALSTISDDISYPIDPVVQGCIYYYKGQYSLEKPMMHDARDFMLKNLSTEDFKTWDDIFHKTVVYSVHPEKSWITVYNLDFSSFTLTDSNFGGLSMFIPRSAYSKIQGYESANVAIKKMQWSNIVDWSKWGWVK